MFNFVVLILVLVGIPLILRFLWTRDDASLYKQCLIVSGYFLVIILSALLSPLTTKNPLWMLFWLFALGPVFFLSLIRLNKPKIVKPAHLPSPAKQDKGRRARLLVLLFVVVVFLRIWMLGTPLSGDHSEYYAFLIRACRQFDFSPESLLNFNLCGHASHGFGLFFSPGVFLFPNNVAAVQFMEMGSAGLCSVLLYLIVSRLSRTSSDILAFLAGASVVTLPINWIQSQGFTPDFGLVLFFIFLLYCDVSHLSILTFFCALLLGFSKEPGWVLLASYGIAKGLTLLAESEGPFGRRFTATLLDGRILPLFVACLAGLFYFLLNGVGWTAGAFYASETADMASWTIEYNSFGFDADFATTRLLEIFVVNFTWVFSILLVLAVILLLKHRGRTRQAARLAVYEGAARDNMAHDVKLAREFRLTMISCAAALAFFTLFMVLSISACSLRYTSIASSIVVIMVFLAVTQLPRLDARRVTLCSAIGAVLIFAQACMPADIVTNLLFPPVSIGDASVLLIAQSTNTEPGRDYYYCNLQCLWLDKAIEVMLEESDFSDGDVILVAGDSFTSAEVNGIRTEVNGRLLTTDELREAHRVKKWDTESRRYVNNFEPVDTNLVTLSTNSFFDYSPLSGSESLSDESKTRSASQITQGIEGKAVLFFSPLNNVDEQETLDALSPYFFVGERQIAEALGGELVFYVLAPKPMLYGTSDFPGSLSIPDDSFQGDTIPVETDGGTVAIYDHNTIYRIPEPSTTECTNLFFSLLGGELEDTDSDDSRTLIREGDGVACRIRIERNGEWVRYPVEPSGVIMTTLYAGHAGYINELGELLVGKSLGEEIVFTSDEISPWMSDSERGVEYTYSVVPTDIVQSMPELTDSFFQAIGYASRETYAYAVMRLANSSIPANELAHACILASSFEPDPGLSLIYRSYMAGMYESKAHDLGLSLEDFVAQYLGMTTDSFEQFCEYYGRYLAMANEINLTYLGFGADIGWTLPS